MKMNIQKILPAVLMLTCGLTLSSCLKDEGYLDVYQGKNAQSIAEFQGDQNSTKGLILQHDAQDVAFTVNIASSNFPTQDIAVTIGVDPTLLEANNADPNATPYELLPTELYTIPSPSVVIKAGQREANFIVKVSQADTIFAQGKSYALPLTITDALGTKISGNFKSILVPLVVNNDYAGDYHSNGLFNHPTAGPRDIDRDKTLATVDASTSETEFADLGASAKMWLKVNPDNTVTITPKGTASPSTVPNGVNVYDPATQSFTLHYKYVGGGGDRVIDEVITRK